MKLRVKELDGLREQPCDLVPGSLYSIRSIPLPAVLNWLLLVFGDNHTGHGPGAACQILSSFNCIDYFM